MIPEIKVSLIIRGEAITSELLDKFNDLGATKCWAKGQKRTPRLSYADNGCRFSSNPEISYNAHTVAINFLTRLIASNPNLFMIIKKYSLNPMLYIAVYVSDVFPSFHFECNDVNLIAKHNIGIDIDCLFISDSSHEK
jgi:hypothetical protein